MRTSGASASAAITQDVTVSSTPNPFGSGNVFDYHNVENDAYAFQTLPFTVDSYYELDRSTSPARLLLLGSNTVDDQKNVTSVQYAPP